ncbi:MAG: hypothetical protein C4551_02410 [Bacillota bacterium]|nr:MAG: hypothetical protein C4551_02410 [Bacillota bacterium]
MTDRPRCSYYHDYGGDGAACWWYDAFNDDWTSSVCEWPRRCRFPEWMEIGFSEGRCDDDGSPDMGVPPDAGGAAGLPFV